MRRPIRTETEPHTGPTSPDQRAGLRREGLLTALGRTVRALRTERGYSQQALAVAAGLSPRFVAQLEAGDGNISVANLSEMARALGVPPGLLIESGDATGSGSEAASLRRQIYAELEGLRTDKLHELLSSLRVSARPAGPRASTVLALVGLRGAGKSTLGPILADAMERTFLELDDRIQELTGLAVSEIFELHGEGYYREAERRALERLLERGDPVVVAVSGGAVTDPAVFRLLRERTLLVWVRATPEQHMRRVVTQGDQRPMANRPDAMAELRHLLRARTPFYAQARLVADTTSTSPESCVARLQTELEGLGG